MTIIDPRLQIKQCPECAGLICEFLYHSSNSFGLQYWTDGWSDGCSPDIALLVICPFCRVALWRKELELIGYRMLGKSETPKPFGSAKSAEMPEASDYRAELDKVLGVPDKERYIRENLWWSLNDVRRHTTQEIPYSEEEIMNLEALAALFAADEANTRDEYSGLPLQNLLRSEEKVLALWEMSKKVEDDLLERAEVLRALGKFDEALAVLATNQVERRAQYVDQLETLIKSGSRYVQKVKKLDKINLYQ